MKLPRYRMKMHEKLEYGTVVSACLSEDVQRIEDTFRSVKERLDDWELWVGDLLDAYDEMPSDLKGQLIEFRFGRILEKKLQETDLDMNACPACGSEPGVNIDCHTCFRIAKKLS